MLEVRGVHAAYGGTVQALRGVDLTVDRGSVVALLGSNGAGKSTLLRAVSGVLPLQNGAVVAGDIRFDGRSLVGRDPAAVVAAGVVQVPEGRRIFGRLTVEENLRVGGYTADRAARERARARVAELFPVLDERRRQRAGLLSGGEQQMLAIGRALMASPRLLLLDEPSLGLAPRVIQQIGDIIRDINRAGTSVLLVEQNAQMALAVADRAYVLDVGTVSLSGTGDELAGSDEVVRLYLGHDGAGRVGAGGAAAGAVAPGRRLTRWTP